MKEHPILFSAPMVKAILEGRKTQTRRVAKLPPAPNHLGEWESTTIGGVGVVDSHGMAVPEHPVIWHTRTGKIIPCPYGEPGTRLWVRETFAYAEGGQVIYRASESDLSHYEEIMIGPWHPSIFLPRKFSRITLEIVSVRPERLQEISPHELSTTDLLAEGLPKHNFGIDYSTSLERYVLLEDFKKLWNSINGKRYPWDSNPFVWKIGFRVLEVLHG